MKLPQMPFKFTKSDKHQSEFKPQKAVPKVSEKTLEVLDVLTRSGKAMSFNARSKPLNFGADEESRDALSNSIIDLEDFPNKKASLKRKSMLVDQSKLPELLPSKEFIRIDLNDCRLTSVDFLLKYVSMHSNVARIDLKGNALAEGEIEKLLEMLKANIVIT